METRKITIVSTVNQTKKVINSAATTLGELKVDLDNAGIDYEDMTFYEGTAKVELLSDNSVLPQNVNYKGTVTNNLVFLLTNSNKKIKSGSNRGSLYDAIKALNLEDVVKEVFGKNFTMCKNVDLERLLEDETKKAHAVKAPDAPACEIDVVEAIKRLLECLVFNDCISKKEAKVIRELLVGEEPNKSPYSDGELEEMFENLI